MHRSRTALLAVCGGLALNGFTLGPMWMLKPTETFSQTAALPAFAISQRISWVLLTALVILVPALFGAGRRGTPASWLTPVTQLAVAAQAATAFTMGFAAPWLAEVAPHTLDVPGGVFQFAMTAVWIVFIAVMVIAATMLWRAGHNRLGCVLAILGALAIPGVGAVGSGVLATGLGLVALGNVRTADRLGNPLEPASA